MLAKNRYKFEEGAKQMNKNNIFLSIVTVASFELPLLAQEMELAIQDKFERICPLHQDIENTHIENEQIEKDLATEHMDIKPTEQPEPIHPTLVPAPVSNPAPTATSDAAPADAQAEQINEDNQSAQRILQHFAQVVAHFFSLVKDPKNPKVVQPNLNGMFSNMVSIFMEALKKNRNGLARRAPMPKEHADLAKKFNETVNQMVRKS